MGEGRRGRKPCWVWTVESGVVLGEESDPELGTQGGGGRWGDNWCQGAIHMIGLGGQPYKIPAYMGSERFCGHLKSAEIVVAGTSASRSLLSIFNEFDDLKECILLTGIT